MKEKSYKKKEKEIIDASIGSKEFRVKENYEAGFRFFCKQIWKELNENIWGKLIILTGIIFLIGDVIIIITKTGGTIELVFIIFFGALFCFLIIMYIGKTLHKEEEDVKNPSPIEEFIERIERTGWTLEQENEFRKIDGLTPLKSIEEYKRLFEEEKSRAKKEQKQEERLSDEQWIKECEEETKRMNKDILENPRSREIEREYYEKAQ